MSRHVTPLLQRVHVQTTKHSPEKEKEIGSCFHLVNTFSSLLTACYSHEQSFDFVLDNYQTL